MISDKMRELRESTGMSARKFAETLGVKYTTYYGYETGSREPGSDFIVKFADYFHVSVDYLLGIEKEKPSNSAEAEPEGTEKWLIDLLVKGGYLPEGQDLDDRSAAPSSCSMEGMLSGSRQKPIIPPGASRCPRIS